MSATITQERVTPETIPAPRKSVLLLTAGILTLVVGFGSFAGGIFGAVYTWNQAAAENVVTPDDAAIPETPVRGPFTMWAQADIITTHQLDRTEGLRFSEMPRLIPLLDEAGQPVVDEAGEAVMVPNEARTSWITATTLTTALNMGILAYALSAFAIVVGLALVVSGFVFLRLRQPAFLL